MFIEGITLLIKTSNRALRYSGSNRSKIRNQKLLLGWGLPAILVALGAIVGFATNTYMDVIEPFGPTQCWLSNKYTIFYITVFAPLCLIYVICVLIFGKVLFFIYEMSKSSEQLTLHANNERSKSVLDTFNIIHLRATLKSFGLLFFVLGIPLIFAFLSGTSIYCINHRAISYSAI